MSLPPNYAKNKHDHKIFFLFKKQAGNEWKQPSKTTTLISNYTCFLATFVSLPKQNIISPNFHSANLFLERKKTVKRPKHWSLGKGSHPEVWCRQLNLMQVLVCWKSYWIYLITQPVGNSHSWGVSTTLSLRIFHPVQVYSPRFNKLFQYKLGAIM